MVPKLELAQDSYGNLKRHVHGPISRDTIECIWVEAENLLSTKPCYRELIWGPTLRNSLHVVPLPQADFLKLCPKQALALEGSN